MPTILVADDNSNIQKMVSLVFKEKGIRVVAVGNGEAACRKVPEVHPDVVLADVFMPVRNGYEVCEFVKQDPQFAETPVILLVGAFDPLDEKEAQRVGANGVLKKPFVPPEPLIAMVSSLLKIEPAAEEPPAPRAPELASMPQSPAESGPTARQRAIASAQAQYAETNEDEAVTTFSAPIAVPSSQDPEMEEVDSEPASEWAKRRASMDYEIDAADSADMVERLAAQGSATGESEVQAASKHVPFGGASIPGMPGDSVRKASPGHWPGSATEVPSEQAPAVVENILENPEFSVSSGEEQEAEMLVDTGVTSEPTHENVFALDSPAPVLSAPWESAATKESPATDAQEIILEAQTEPPPEIHVAQSPAEDVPATREPLKPFREMEKAASPLEEKFASHLFPKSVSPSPAPSEDVDTASAEEAPLDAGAIEAAAKEAASKSAVDQATVDDVVAKVISKLEPQLHQALANGVLRPLVEELLNQREKK